MAAKMGKVAYLNTDANVDFLTKELTTLLGPIPLSIAKKLQRLVTPPITSVQLNQARRWLKASIEAGKYVDLDA